MIRRAHPRSRGENALDFNPNHTLGGSSPLTRGKLATIGYDCRWAGLIPAHAGKTWRSGPVARRSGAHPRSRGENHAPLTTGSNHPGSSPLTRGKLLASSRAVIEGGLIPAHAGKTRKRLVKIPHETAHPRSRGENVCCWSVCVCTSGSSPLTRGKHHRRRQLA